MGYVDGMAAGERSAGMTTFATRLAAIQQAKNSEIALFVAPRLLRMPLPIQRYDDPFLPFAKAIINATRDLVCAYVFDFAAYLALGAAGAVALERTVPYVNANGDTMAILHAPFSSIDYVEAVGKVAFNFDAVTVSDSVYAPAYHIALEGGVFVAALSSPLNADYGWLSLDERRATITVDDVTVNIHLIGDEVLYTGRGDDFAEQARAALMNLRK